ncbi:MAG: CPBP family intramembrane glutamic endopeptidase, partial [Ignavibacteriaceae bacterium]
GNLKDFEARNINNIAIIFFTSLLFSIIHYPSFLLIIATFIMALFYSIIFLRKRNIIPLGIFHGILGGLFYYFVLNRDPWLELISFIKK